MADTVVATESQSSADEHGSRKLSAFLCWAVVFADIGTSVYYVPGILWRQVQWQSGLFVLLTLVAFTLLVFTYAEVSVRFPEGGGVVTAAANGFVPLVGAVGGMFILGSYFLTSAISSLSGLLYFSTIFEAITPYVLVITVVMIVLLGLLNFWGIKESATVSAFIAMAALVSDIVILIVVFMNVPLPTIGLVMEKVLSGDLSGLTLLTGFSGAFLAFSGLESISQLSPVMALPRRKTVTRALALVAITVGVTSPLLTIFSTVLLNSPELLATTTIQMQVTPTPDTFISDLGGTYGGTILSIATALAASTLLVFACNTAIIGAYHVFMALSRMGYLPKPITSINAWRGTPHNAIFLATIIPVIVLIGVRGQIEILGDLYAFGLLGAFSLTCLSMSVIRYRERRGSRHIGAVEAAELSTGIGATVPAGVPLRTRLSDAAGAHMNPQVVERIRVASASTQQRLSPWTTRLRQAWPTINFYIGILTTILVSVAWITNLFSKPLATIFGGGFTVVGVAVAYLYHQRLVRAGEAPVAPIQRLQRTPNSLLVALSSESEYNRQVIDSAIETADDHQLVFLYLSRKPTRSPQFMQFADPYLTDIEAQRTLTYAQIKAKRAGLKASFIYRLGGAGQVIDIWRIIRPDEIIAEAEIAKKVSKYVQPDYVRYQQEEGVRVAHYVRHQLPGPMHQAPPGSSGSGLATGVEKLGQLGSQMPPTPPPEPGAEAPITSRGMRNGRPPAPKPARPPKRHPAAEVPPMETPEGRAGGGLDANEEEWIWTGTDLVRKPPQENEPEEKPGS
ncbi:MAG TPA: APC family permease [Ktedonobacterales bacterium]|nr:APC family permease [Ktedonobacterales bacterium]